MARSSYSFQKRQKELARKQKKEEKRRNKLEKNTVTSMDDQEGIPLAEEPMEKDDTPPG